MTVTKLICELLKRTYRTVDGYDAMVSLTIDFNTEVQVYSKTKDFLFSIDSVKYDQANNCFIIEAEEF